MGADLFEQLPRALSPLAPADPPPAPGALQTEGNVLGHRQIGKEGQLLIDGGDAQLVGTAWIVLLDRLPGDLEASRVGLVSPGDDLDEGRLAGAVLAYERVHFTGLQLERNALQGLNAGKRLADLCEFEESAHRPSSSTLMQDILLIGPDLGQPRRAGRNILLQAVIIPDGARRKCFQLLQPGQAGCEG